MVSMLHVVLMSALEVSETNHEEPIRGLIGIHQEYIIQKGGSTPLRVTRFRESLCYQHPPLAGKPRTSSHKLLTFCTSEMVSETTYVASLLRGASTRNLLPLSTAMLYTHGDTPFKDDKDGNGSRRIPTMQTSSSWGPNFRLGMAY